MMREGEGRYTAWKKRTQSLSYIFKQDMETILANQDLDAAFAKKDPVTQSVLKLYLSGDISLETLVIWIRILGYRKNFDKKLEDPVWQTVSLRMRKYSPFLNIDVFQCKKIVKEDCFRKMSFLILKLSAQR